MKIITWNCAGAFRKKFEYLSDYQADILIIQECENPGITQNRKYKEWGCNHIWFGDNKNKGIGIFAERDVSLHLLDWSDYYEDRKVKYFLPCLVNDNLQILAIWSHYNNSPTFGYIGQIWKYLQVNKNKFQDILLVGDFNSNVFWDKSYRRWNHSDIVRELNELNISSAYHYCNKEEQGQESKPTFFHRSNKNHYHIDYVFAHRKFLNEKCSFIIDSAAKWHKLSDHLPIIFEFQ